jgi:hypothetical protein
MDKAQWLKAYVTGGGGGFDTSDATITENDVLVGMIAYGKEGRIVGVLPNFFQSLSLGLSVPTMPTIEENAEDTTV